MKNQQFPFCISVEELQGGEISDRHDYDFSEIIYVASGSGTYLYRETTLQIAKGDVLIIQPGLAHAYGAHPDSNLRIYRVMFQQRLLNREWPALNHAAPFIDPIFIDPFFCGNKQLKSHISLKTKEQIELTILLDRMVSEYLQKSWGHHCMIRMLLVEIFLFLGRWSKDDRGLDSDTAGTKKDVFSNVCVFIKQHYMQQISLEEVRNMCGMSQSTFTMNFKKMTGFSFIDYRNRVRIRAAKELLENTDLAIINVSQKVGFDDLSNFDRTFKRFEGLSPLNYRKSKSSL
ncbi:AraC family transcriptional regulator [Sporolactobacillus pectinivorans]|uniref:AraC family transcriptional regulator n=1 Tax=Sporolactobacillus pectinivorans TaxID=1591408 RepID=UPI001EFD4406|nr:helix-turn-helix domain-containing protein [Sporolactobacillus pectinivorans]